MKRFPKMSWRLVPGDGRWCPDGFLTQLVLIIVLQAGKAFLYGIFAVLEHSIKRIFTLLNAYDSVVLRAFYLIPSSF